MKGQCVPHVIFKTRVGDAPPENGSCPIGGEWRDVTTADLFRGKRVILFSLPGAFTPTCSTYQLPGFEEGFQEFQSHGISEIYCLSVNDSFVMNEWARQLGIKNVKVIPDGNGEFTRLMGQLVEKNNVGFGPRSWRYAAVIDNGVVEAWFEELGRCDNFQDDPYGESSPDNVLRYLRGIGG